MNDDDGSLANFTGPVRLFPLPNLVLFPQVVQPLHMFEPRYRQLTTDALDDDRLLALVLLRPGWEPDYEGKPAIYSVACLGKILAEQRLDDGRYNLLLRGLGRVRIVQEILNDKLYRSAAVEVMVETAVADQLMIQVLRNQLVEVVRPWFEAQPEIKEQLQRLLDNDLELGMLCDVLAFALPLSPANKQWLLEEGDVARRVVRLVKYLGDQAKQVSNDRKFPPEFSEN